MTENNAALQFIKSTPYTHTISFQIEGISVRRTFAIFPQDIEGQEEKERINLCLEKIGDQEETLMQYPSPQEREAGEDDGITPHTNFYALLIHTLVAEARLNNNPLSPQQVEDRVFVIAGNILQPLVLENLIARNKRTKKDDLLQVEAQKGLERFQKEFAYSIPDSVAHTLGAESLCIGEALKHEGQPVGSVGKRILLLRDHLIRYVGYDQETLRPILLPKDSLTETPEGQPIHPYLEEFFKEKEEERRKIEEERKANLARLLEGMEGESR